MSRRSRSIQRPLAQSVFAVPGAAYGLSGLSGCNNSSESIEWTNYDLGAFFGSGTRSERVGLKLCNHGDKAIRSQGRYGYTTNSDIRTGKSTFI